MMEKPKPMALLRSLFAVAAAVATTAFILLGSACSGNVDALVRTDSSARVSIRVEVPQSLSQRIRQFGQIPPNAALFDAAAAKKSFGVRKSIQLIDVAVPDKDSMTSVLWVPKLDILATDKSLVPAGLLNYALQPASGTMPAGRELRVRITRDNAAAIYALFPGLDSRLVSTLSPPALEKDPVSAADYRMNLEAVIIGKNGMPAFDAAMVSVNITAPRPIVGSAGGLVTGQTLKARIPLFDLLTLEKPVEFWLRWTE